MALNLFFITILSHPSTLFPFIAITSLIIELTAVVTKILFKWFVLGVVSLPEYISSSMMVHQNCFACGFISILYHCTPWFKYLDRMRKLKLNALLDSGLIEANIFWICGTIILLYIWTFILFPIIWNGSRLTCRLFVYNAMVTIRTVIYAQSLFINGDPPIHVYAAYRENYWSYCAICWYDFNNTKIESLLLCGHKFHALCLNQWERFEFLRNPFKILACIICGREYQYTDKYKYRYPVLSNKCKGHLQVLSTDLINEIASF
eukprot:315398_1